MKYFDMVTLESRPTQNFPKEIENITDLEKKRSAFKNSLMTLFTICYFKSCRRILKSNIHFTYA